ncbi:MAG TPA: hypothetical protein VLL52_21820 [Anaerolineae bacterium]|nr:hypothetical protein [Anaerolineae bacterium]
MVLRDKILLFVLVVGGVLGLSWHWVEGRSELKVMGVGGQEILFASQLSDNETAVMAMEKDGKGLIQVTEASNRMGMNYFKIVDGLLAIGVPLHYIPEFMMRQFHGVYQDGPVWSPDGSQFAFAAGRQYRFYWSVKKKIELDVYVAEGDGSDVRRLTEGIGDVRGQMIWSPDGSALLVEGEADLYLIDVMTGRNEILLAGMAVNDEPTWSPDGKRIVVAMSRGYSAELYLVEVESGEIEQLSWVEERVLGYRTPTWSPDGSQLAVRFCDWERCQVQVLGVDEAGVPMVGDEEQVWLFEFSLFLTPLTWSPDGHQIVLRGQKEGVEGLYVIDVVNDGVQLVVEDRRIDGGLSWRPDGKEILFTSYGDGDGEIFVVGPDGSGLQQLTFNEVKDWGPVWR